jgi:hypothetical protein
METPEMIEQELVIVEQKRAEKAAKEAAKKAKSRWGISRVIGTDCRVAMFWGEVRHPALPVIHFLTDPIQRIPIVSQHPANIIHAVRETRFHSRAPCCPSMRDYRRGQNQIRPNILQALDHRRQAPCRQKPSTAGRLTRPCRENRQCMSSLPGTGH